MMKALLRGCVQLIMSGPLLLFYPASLLAISAVLRELLTGTFGASPSGVFYAGVGVGLTGLYASILLPMSWVRASWWLRWGIAAMVAVGIGMAVSFVMVNDIGWRNNPWLALWMMGGPFMVLVWNGWRLWRGGP
ncbi:MAG: hypothetical protein HQL66_10815 [Magnetococcales bacterium]|nr:hypothetical protein [Magnetococcales bacterium]